MDVEDLYFLLYLKNMIPNYYDVFVDVKSEFPTHINYIYLDLKDRRIVLTNCRYSEYEFGANYKLLKGE